MFNGKRLKSLESENTQLREILQRAGGEEIPQIQDALAAIRHEHHQFVNNANAERQHLESQLHAERTRVEAQIQAEQVRLEAQGRETQRKLQAIQGEVEQRTRQVDELKSIYENTAEFVDSGLVNYEHPAQSSVLLQSHLDEVRSRIKAMVRTKIAVSATTNFTFNNSVKEGRKFVQDMSKLLLRAYNAEAENCVKTVRAGNLPSAQKRLERTKDQVEKLGKMISLHISQEYHQCRLEELRIASQYLEMKKSEKEEERERRAIQREEARVQKELEAARSKLNKERSHLENVVSRLREQGKLDEVTEIEEKLKDVDRALADVDYRSAHERAGYVYVISNIGAFGKDVVKIGMTRRLEPMDRIRELGDASVPFNFDVHAMFFSEDAFGVEAELHRRFSEQRINKVNLRREYFRVTPARVKAELEQIGGNLLDFVEEPEAEQYQQSMQLTLQNSPAYS